MWKIHGRYRSVETNRLRDGVLTYLTPGEASSQRALAQLAGTPELVALVEGDVRVGTLVAPTATSATRPASMDDPNSVLLLAVTRMVSVSAVEGDTGGEVQPIPAGAVA